MQQSSGERKTCCIKTRNKKTNRNNKEIWIVGEYFSSYPDHKPCHRLYLNTCKLSGHWLFSQINFCWVSEGIFFFIWVTSRNLSQQKENQDPVVFIQPRALITWKWNVTSRNSLSSPFSSFSFSPSSRHTVRLSDNNAFFFCLPLSLAFHPITNIQHITFYTSEDQL